MGSICSSKQNINECDVNYGNILSNKYKALLLGTGSSGKSTLFKQLKRIFSEDPTIYDIRLNNDKFATVLVSNIIETIGSIYKQRKSCVISDNAKVELNQLSKTRKHIWKALKTIVGIYNSNYSFEKICELNIGRYIKDIWNLKFIQEIYGKYKSKMYYYDNMEYFIDKSNEIFNVDYKVTHNDILKMRIRTGGLNSINVNVGDSIFEIWDVGGMRSERNKWQCLYGNVNVLIYVVGLTHYCNVLFEDCGVNAMNESIKCFENIVSNNSFKDSMVVLLFVKNDLFRNYLKSGYNLDICFGNKWNSKYNCEPKCDQYSRKFVYNYVNKYGYNPVPTYLCDIITTYLNNFDESYHKSIKYIESVFRSKCKRLKKDNIYTTSIGDINNSNDIKHIFIDLERKLSKEYLITQTHH